MELVFCVYTDIWRPEGRTTQLEAVVLEKLGSMLPHLNLGLCIGKNLVI